MTQKNGEIPAWAIRRTKELAPVPCSPYGIREAFARYIEQHEQPPVDPDLLIARKVAATHPEFDDCIEKFLRGDHDEDLLLTYAVAAIKLARERGTL